MAREVTASTWQVSELERNTEPQEQFERDVRKSDRELDALLTGSAAAAASAGAFSSGLSSKLAALEQLFSSAGAAQAAAARQAAAAAAEGCSKSPRRLQQQQAAAAKASAASAATAAAASSAAALLAEVAELRAAAEGNSAQLASADAKCVVLEEQRQRELTAWKEVDLERVQSRCSAVVEVNGYSAALLL